MRIAMLGHKGIPAIYGGIERHVEELSAELVKQGHEVFAYSRRWYSPHKLTKHRGIKVIYSKTINTKHLDAIIHTFTATIKAMAQKMDVIHYHGVGPSLLAWMPRIFSPKTKVVCTFHCIDRYHQKWGAFARLMLWLGEKAACVFPHETIAVSKTIQNYCLNEYRTNTTYNPNGVIMEEKTDALHLAKWNLEPNKYLVMVSRLVKHKGAHYLIEAWKKARQEEPKLNDLKLVIVGGSSFTDDYVRYIKKLSGDDDSIIFTDWQNGEPLRALYGNALMLVHPSENEGLPITVLQAMSFGRPALVSDIPEHQEVITDSRFWSANASTFSLTKKIIELFKNPDLLEKAGKDNLETVINYFQWKDIAKKTSDLYKMPILEKSQKKLKTA